MTMFVYTGEQVDPPVHNGELDQARQVAAQDHTYPPEVSPPLPQPPNILVEARRTLPVIDPPVEEADPITKHKTVVIQAPPPPPPTAKAGLPPPGTMAPTAHAPLSWWRQHTCCVVR